MEEEEEEAVGIPRVGRGDGRRRGGVFAQRGPLSRAVSGTFARGTRRGVFTRARRVSSSDEGRRARIV